MIDLSQYLSARVAPEKQKPLLPADPTLKGITQTKGIEMRNPIIHGHAPRTGITPTYRARKGAIQRCTNPNNPKYARYGGRGISVCKRWMESFNNFLEDMGEKPEGMTLGRIDNDGDYCPENCRWEDLHQQANNRSNNRIIEYDGKRMTLSQWADHLDMSFVALRMRLHRGWSVERAFNKKIEKDK